MEPEAGLLDYLVVLARKWWVVAATVVVATVVAVFYSLGLQDQFEARTQLLMVPRISEQLLVPRISDAPVDSRELINPVGASLSADTLSTLATANDLMADIIEELTSSNPGRSIMAVESLRGMITTRVEVSQRGATQIPLPLLTTTVRGTDPQLVTEIANKWAELFIQVNAQLFASETARSYEFILFQYNENKQALELKTRERLAYLRESPLQPLVSELSVVIDEFEEFRSQLESKRAALVATQATLDSLETALAGEPQTIELTRRISTEGLFNLLRNNPNESSLQAVADLEVKEEIENPVYLSLKVNRAEATTSLATLTAEVSYIEGKTAEFKTSIEELSKKIGEIQRLTSGIYQTVETRRLRSSGFLDQETREIKFLSSGLLDREIETLQDNVDLLARRLQEARLAKDEEVGSFRVVETAVVPQVAVGTNRDRIVVTTAILALVLGAILAFLLHYIQQGLRGVTSPPASPGPSREEPSDDPQT